MTQLKHIISLVLMLAIFGLQAKAQSTSRSPYEGALHSYTCNGITVGANFDFFMTSDAAGTVVLNDDLTGEFDILNKTGVVGSDGLAATYIQWNTGAAAHIFYLWLEANLNGCSNRIGLEVTPQVNQFDLLSENVPVSNTVSCPATASTDGFNPVAGAYEAGSTLLQFKVKREFGTDNTLTAMAGDTYDWSFIPQLVVDPDLAAHTNVIITIEGNNSGVVLADASNRYTINGQDDEVTVTVSIQNEPGYDLKVDLTVTGQKEHNTNLSDSDPTNDNVTHTIQVMPVIGGMGGV